MAKFYIDYRSVNSKSSDLSMYIQKYDKCVNESCYNLQKTDYCWQDQNQEIFMRSVKRLRNDVSEQIKQLRRYAEYLNEFYSSIRISIVSNFDYNYVNTIKYDTDYANRAIEALNRVINRLDWINREMPSCIVPSDYPYKNVIDNITGATFPYCNDVVRFNSRIASVNSNMLKILNEFYYKMKSIKTVVIDRQNLNHQYQIITPQLKKVKFDDIEEIKGKSNVQVKVNVSDDFKDLSVSEKNASAKIGDNLQLNQESDDLEVNKINANEALITPLSMNRKYDDLSVDEKESMSQSGRVININNDYDDPKLEKKEALSDGVNSITMNDDLVQLQDENVKSSSNEGVVPEFQDYNSLSIDKADTASGSVVNELNFASSNGVEINKVSADQVSASVGEFQNSNSLDINKVTADQISSSVGEFQNSSSLDINKVTADQISSSIDGFQNSNALNINKVSADQISSSVGEFQNSNSLDVNKVTADSIINNQ